MNENETSTSPARPAHGGLEGRIAEIIAPTLEAQGYELVQVKVIGRETPTVQVMADRADDAAFTLDDCTAVSHLLSSRAAGIAPRLTRVKDWNRFAGHDAKVELNFPGPGGRKRFTGVVLGADEEAATLKLETGEVVALKLADVAKAKLVLTDALIKFTTQPVLTN